jgi:ATP-dependent DNA helicase RecG
LRGRVGRGDTASYCVLLYQSPLSEIAQQRLQTLRDTNDGFVLAQRDLELRGPGELLGTRQTGLPQFRTADLAQDQQVLPAIREAAQWLEQHAPEAIAPLLARWLSSLHHYAEV